MKVTVIIPVYNVERYLNQCLESVISQSYTDLEIILVDDESTDGSGIICDFYAQKDARIKVVHQKNGGVSSARNTGIKLATGEYITFVDSDDWIHREMYSKMVIAAQKNNTPDVLMCDFINVRETSQESVTSGLRHGIYDKDEIIKEIYPTLLVTEHFGRIPIVSACTCLFKKLLLDNFEIEFDVDLRYSEDYLFMAKVMVGAKAFYYLKENYFYFYRQYEQSRSKKFQPEWWVTMLSLNEKLAALLTSRKDFDFTEQIKLQLIHSVLFYASSVVNNSQLPYNDKIKALTPVFGEKRLQLAFSNIILSKYPLGLHYTLLLIKYKRVKEYIWLHKLITTLRNT